MGPPYEDVWAMSVSCDGSLNRIRSAVACPRRVEHGSRDMDDPLVREVRAYLAEHDPDVLAAVDDVDRSLIQAELRRSPLERLVSSAKQARFYERLAASLPSGPDRKR